MPLFRRRDRAPEHRSVLPGIGGSETLVDPSAIPPYPGYGTRIAGIPVNQETMLQVPAIFTAIRVICFAVTKLGDPYAYTLSRSDDNVPYRERVEAQPRILTDTFGGDHGGLMNYDGRARTVASMALFGEAWWYVLERDREGNPETVEPLHPLWLDIQSHAGRKTYVYGFGAERRVLAAENLMHIPLLSLPGRARGLSALNYLQIAGGLALASLQFGSLFFEQGQSPSFLLETDQAISEEDARRLVQRFLVQHAGLSKSHLPLLLDKGLKATKVPYTPDEAQFNQTHETATSMIAAFFGVPGLFIGSTAMRGNPFGPGATEEVMRLFEATCVVGYVVALEEAYSRLLPPEVFAAFDESRLLRPGAQQQAALIQTLRQTNSASINDIRTRYLGLAPVQGGDQVIAPLASNTAPEQTVKPEEDHVA